MSDIERHPLQPFLPHNCQLLMLGSFPPSKKRWCMDFFYPNFINDMWRIFGLVFFEDKLHFVDTEHKMFHKDAIETFLINRGIGIFDTACAIRRTNNTASDKFLEVVEATDLDALLRNIPLCKAVVTTGQKATDVFISHFNIAEPKVGGFTEFTFDDRPMRLYRMPSSSRAYPMKIEKKAEKYRDMFHAVFGDV
jgi:G:T/U-mismatch repair DNA glycosylase